MDTQAFLEAVLPPEGVYLIAINTPQGFRHKAFTDLSQAASFVRDMDSSGKVVYHACASYKQKPYKDESGRSVCRTRPNWGKAKAFWFDVDCGAKKAEEGKGYTTKREGATALLSWFKKYGLPLPMLVDSGNGIHGYLILSQAIDSTEWTRYAQALKSKMSEDGVLVDPSRTADFASVLRPVGSHNRKNPDKPRDVKVLYQQAAPVDLEEIKAAIDSMGILSLDEVPDYLKNEKVEALVDYEPVPTSAVECAKHCQQMRLMQETKGDVSYDHWRGVIGVIKFCNEGIELAHEWSSLRGETGHSNVDVDTRYNTWGSAPTTCEFFRKCNPDGCKGCKFAAKIKSPIVLGRVEPAQKAETVEVVIEDSEKAVAVEIPEMPSGYDWTGKSLRRFIPDKEGVLHPYVFCNTRFYFINRIRRSDGTFEYTARAHLPNSILREFAVSGGLIGTGGPKLFELLGSYEVLPSCTKDAVNNMSAYIKEAVTKLMETRAVTSTHSSYGWQEDGKFLMGARLYSADGKETEALLNGYALDKQACFPRPKGSVEDYAKHINWIYNRDGMEPMQYFISSLWASPLVNLCEPLYKGIPCALTGVKSGKGKTTAGICALYAFGDASELSISGKKGGTRNSQSALLGTLGNLPILFDEVTNLSSETLSDMCYSLSNGAEPMRLKSTGGRVGFAIRETWRLHSGMTANTSIMERLSQKGNAEAETMRVFEIRVDSYNIPALDPVAVSTAVTAIERTAGSAGEVLLKYIITHQAEVTQMLVDNLTKVATDANISSDAKYRYYRNHIACTLTAAQLMKKLCGIKFDVDRMLVFALGVVSRISEANALINSVDAMDVFSLMLRDMGPRIISTPWFKRPDSKALLDVRCPLGVIGRAITGCGEYNDEYTGKLYLETRSIIDWCAEHRVDFASLRQQLKEAAVLVECNSKIRLGTGTTITSAQTRVWVLDLTKLDLEDSQHAES